MKKRLIAFLLLIIAVMGLLPSAAFAAPSLEDALGDVQIYNGGNEMNYLSMNGIIRIQRYTYYNFDNGSGHVREIPAYCMTPTTPGVPDAVSVGESITYSANEKTSDPKVLGIVANGYPTRTLAELKLNDKYEAYYATKMALWTYLRDSWDMSRMTVNPNLSGTQRERAEAILAAAQEIYTRGTAWGEALSPEVTCTPDRNTAYPVTIDGKQYKQQVFTVHSKTWVCDYTIYVAFTNPDDVPAGTRIVDMENRDITRITAENIDTGLAGKFKVLYPADEIEGKSGNVQLSFRLDVYQYAVFYAVCAQKDEYGNLQEYVVDTDPTKTMRLSAFSNYGEGSVVTPPVGGGDDPEPEPQQTALRILKYETGTETPLAGALMEVISPKGDSIGTFSTNANGQITIPLTVVGNYTVIERSAPANHLISKDSAQNVTVVYDKTATVTFFNDPYGSLRIEKKSNAGENLAGAVITVTHIESGQSYTAITNTAGAAVFEQVKPGAYRVQEKTAPDGYKLDNTVYTTTVVTGETTTLPIINEELPGLRIIKYDRKNYELMPGVTFEVWRDSVSLGKFKTNQMGEIVLTNVEPGTYRAAEVDAGNDGYILDTTPQEVELTAGDGIRELLFFNDMKPGLHLIKVDSTCPNQVIPNAVFEIKSVAGDYGPEEFVTDQNGEIDLSALPAGAYVVTEKSCEGYVIDDAQRIIQLDPNEDAQFIFTNTIKPSMRIIKLSADGSRLAGVSFRIAKIEDGSHYLDRTTNAQGEILISDLEPGVYSVKETATVADHIIDKKEYHVELFPGKTSTLTIQNDKRPNLTVYKYDADTGAPVPDTVFLVEAADGHSVGEIQTDASGKGVLENLLPGVYKVSEKSVPSPYLKDAEPQLITLYPNRDREVYFENHKKPMLTVSKVNSVTSDPIQGAKFQVWYASNNTDSGELNDLGYFYSDENGQFMVGELRDGWYKITELEPAPGFAIKDPATQTVYIKGGESKTVTFENTPLSALVVYKYDSVTGAAVEGAVFQLKYLSGTSGTGGTVIGTYKTSANGSFTVTGLKAGTYIVEELASDSGHVIDTAPQTAYISGAEQDVVKLYFGNSPKGSLLIKKIDSESHKPLSDVQFFVTTSDGTVVGDGNGYFTTDSAGTILIEGITPGTTLVVKETIARPGYVLDDAPQTAQIKAGQTVTLEFRNQPKGNLIINKLDSETGKPLAGVVFELKYANGQFVDATGGKLSSNGRYVTDKNGQIILSGIVGTVVVTEKKTLPGYEIDEESCTQTVVVNPDDTQTLIFYNNPIVPERGQIQVYKYSSEYNTVTGTPAGTPLKGAVYEISNARSGKVVGYITTDARGVAASKPLPLGRYKVVEVTAPGYWQIDPTVHDITLEYPDQIIKISAFDKPSELGVTITKRGNAEVLSGTQMRYDFTVANTSNVSLESFYWHDRIPTDAVKPTTLTTGTYSARLNYRILYKTNYMSGYQVLASNLLTGNNYSFALNAIPMQVGEVVTDIYFDFGKVPVGFQSVAAPTLSVMVNGGTVNGYQIVNRADAGGQYQGTWQTAQTAWVTLVRNLTVITPAVPVKLPQTGF